MSYASACAALENWLQTGWSATPIVWENTIFDPQAPGGSFPVGGAFVSVVMLWGKETQQSFGAAANLYRNTGILCLHVRTAAGTGTTQVYSLMDGLAALFRHGQCAAFTFGAPYPDPGGEEKETGWFRQTLNIPFKLDEFH